MRFTRPAITAGAIAIATGTALTFAMPAFAAPPGDPSGAVRPLLEPVVDPADAKVGDALPEDEIDAQLRALEGTQPQAEIDRIVDSNVPAATLTDSETGEFTAAVVLPTDLRAPGTITVRSGLVNTWGSPVTVTKITR
ncbi:hypothetical protein [Curtobacterium sp. RRHDQ10]|uniref:hypothetical protein n=1 Tax=Curtobacterium phyllosphaerae TaxID=3413379 RepID=UPI003BF06F22